MLTINRIREHWQLAEVERLRREVKEMQCRLERLQCELQQARRSRGPIAVSFPTDAEPLH